MRTREQARQGRPIRLFCQDECRIGLMPIRRRRITARGTKPIRKQKPSYKSFYLYGAIEPETGQRFFIEQDRLNSEGYQFFLDRLSRAFPHSLNVLVLDNGSFHKAKKLQLPGNVEHIFLPPYSPQLNPIERFWQDLKGKIACEQVAWSIHEHLSDLLQRTRERLTDYLDEAVASITAYEYLVDAASALST